MKKILSFLANHPTLRNVVLGAGMVSIAPVTNYNNVITYEWLTAEIKNRASSENISIDKACNVIAQEFGMGRFIMSSVIFSIFIVMVVNPALINIWVAIYVVAVLLVWILPAFYLRSEKNKLK